MPALETAIRILSLMGAVVAFGWGVYQFSVTQRQQVESRRIEATKPFLERQLALYTEATQVASTIATTTDSTKKRQALERFWSLYWGELALVEDAFVEGEMVKFGAALERSAGEDEIRQQALNLAHASRNSLARSWGVAAWESPHWWKPSAGGGAATAEPALSR